MSHFISHIYLINQWQCQWQQRAFIGIECMCMTGLPAVQICFLLKMYGASLRGESDNGDHGLLSSSSVVYIKNGQNCNNWYPQFPEACLPQASISKFAYI